MRHRAPCRLSSAIPSRSPLWGPWTRFRSNPSRVRAALLQEKKRTSRIKRLRRAAQLDAPIERLSQAHLMSGHQSQKLLTSPSPLWGSQVHLNSHPSRVKTELLWTTEWTIRIGRPNRTRQKDALVGHPRRTPRSSVPQSQKLAHLLSMTRPKALSRKTRLGSAQRKARQKQAPRISLTLKSSWQI